MMERMSSHIARSAAFTMPKLPPAYESLAVMDRMSSNIAKLAWNPGVTAGRFSARSPLVTSIQPLAAYSAKILCLFVDECAALRKTYLGACASLRGRLPDYARHFGVSLREAIMHLIRQRAPYTAVRRWTDRPDDFGANGHPTRKARAAYIYPRTLGKLVSPGVRSSGR